jgi:hypothetical protein
MFFSILDSELNDFFFLNDDLLLKKLRLNPSNKALLVGFKQALEKWIQSGTLEDNVVKAILLDSHYEYDIIDIMVGLLDVIDKSSYASFLMDDATRTIVVVCTTHSTKDVLKIYKGPD